MNHVQVDSPKWRFRIAIFVLTLLLLSCSEQQRQQMAAQAQSLREQDQQWQYVGNDVYLRTMNYDNHVCHIVKGTTDGYVSSIEGMSGSIDGIAISISCLNNLSEN